MRILIFIFLCFHTIATAQKPWLPDLATDQQIDDALVDDYSNIYLYNKKNFSWTKYDSIGKEMGRIMMTQPYQIQDVDNPLSIPLFSQNAQSIKFVDAHFTEIQKIDLGQTFGFIVSAYVEDLQQAWLLDESNNRLVQYLFREDKTINSYPINLSFIEIKNILVYDQKLYVLREQSFEIYDFKGKKLLQTPIKQGRKLRRENNKIIIICKNEIFESENLSKPRSIFWNEKSDLLAKNNQGIFVIQKNKIYLYPLN